MGFTAKVCLTASSRMTPENCGHSREPTCSKASAQPAAWSRALYAPPLEWTAGWAEAFEQVGSRLWPQFSGVVLLEAVKQTFAVKPKAPRMRAKAPVLRPLPVGPVLEPSVRFEKRRCSA